MMRQQDPKKLDKLNQIWVEPPNYIQDSHTKCTHEDLH